jgi:hypothetical protein
VFADVREVPTDVRAGMIYALLLEDGEKVATKIGQVGSVG